MSLVIGHAIKDGVPYINGKPAELDEDQTPFMASMFSPWRCPECGAYLAKGSLICLNACHLSAASYKRFQDGLAKAVAEGKPLDVDSIVHHIDEDKHHNCTPLEQFCGDVLCFGNLEIITGDAAAEHIRRHEIWKKRKRRA